MPYIDIGVAKWMEKKKKKSNRKSSTGNSSPIWDEGIIPSGTNSHLVGVFVWLFLAGVVTFSLSFFFSFFFFWNTSSFTKSNLPHSKIPNNPFFFLLQLSCRMVYPLLTVPWRWLIGHFPSLNWCVEQYRSYKLKLFFLLSLEMTFVFLEYVLLLLGQRVTYEKNIIWSFPQNLRVCPISYSYVKKNTSTLERVLFKVLLRNFIFLVRVGKFVVPIVNFDYIPPGYSVN